MSNNRWQLISDDSVWMFPPDISLSTVQLASFWPYDTAYKYESCLFFSNGNSDVVARYNTKKEAIAGHRAIEKKYGLKKCLKLRI